MYSQFKDNKTEGRQKISNRRITSLSQTSAEICDFPEFVSWIIMGWGNSKKLSNGFQLQISIQSTRPDKIQAKVKSPEKYVI